MDSSSNEWGTAEMRVAPSFGAARGIWQAQSLLAQFAERQCLLIEAERNSELHQGYRNSTTELIHRTSLDWSREYIIDRPEQLDTLIRKLRQTTHHRLRAWTFSQLDSIESKSKSVTESARVCLEEQEGFHPRWIPRFDPDRSEILRMLETQMDREPAQITQVQWESLSFQVFCLQHKLGCMLAGLLLFSGCVAAWAKGDWNLAWFSLAVSLVSWKWLSHRFRSWRNEKIAGWIRSAVFELYQMELAFAESVLKEEVKAHSQMCILAIQTFTQKTPTPHLR